MIKRILVLLTALMLAASMHAATETYNIDQVHSSVGFSIRHLFSKFTSGFTKVSGTIAYDAAAPEKSSVTATVEIRSLSTNNSKRDTHVLSADFFDAAKFPTASFQSTTWTKTGEGSFDVTGNLTIKDVTKPVTFKVTFLGSGPGMGGSTVSGWEATTTIKKADFNVAGPAMLGKALGEEVTINIAIEAGYSK